MPTKIKLLKSIHENGGEFEVATKNPDDKDNFIGDVIFQLDDSNIIYFIPSELEVEKKCRELLLDTDFSMSSTFYERGSSWDYQVITELSKEDSERGYYYETHESRLTAGLMLWDKLLKEKK